MLTDKYELLRAKNDEGLPYLIRKEDESKILKKLGLTENDIDVITDFGISFITDRRNKETDDLDFKPDFLSEKKDYFILNVVQMANLYS